MTQTRTILEGSFLNFIRTQLTEEEQYRNTKNCDSFICGWIDHISKEHNSIHNLFPSCDNTSTPLPLKPINVKHEMVPSLKEMIPYTSVSFNSFVSPSFWSAKGLKFYCAAQSEKSRRRKER